jgi:ubiquinone/menaquinone biosynthesis C-methylase UbiE
VQQNNDTMSLAKDSTTRFSNRVKDYVKWRPNYQQEIVKDLKNEYSLSTDKIVADIGSGTGISSELFLKDGYAVIGVEPNEAMRERSKELLSKYSNHTAVDGTAEQTTFGNESVDAIVAGQAFHWFDQGKTRVEFQRILKQDGVVVLLWNERLADTDFAKEYDQFIVDHGKEYVKLDHRNVNAEQIASFFNPGTCGLKTYKNQQVFNFDGLKGRLLSSSYMPTDADENYQPMLLALEQLFEKHNENGMVHIDYDTKVYIGRFK